MQQEEIDIRVYCKLKLCKLGGTIVMRTVKIQSTFVLCVSDKSNQPTNWTRIEFVSEVLSAQIFKIMSVLSTDQYVLVCLPPVELITGTHHILIQPQQPIVC